MRCPVDVSDEVRAEEACLRANQLDYNEENVNEVAQSVQLGSCFVVIDKFLILTLDRRSGQANADLAPVTLKKLPEIQGVRACLFFIFGLLSSSYQLFVYNFDFNA